LPFSVIMSSAQMTHISSGTSLTRDVGLSGGNTCHAPASGVPVQCAYRSLSWQYLRGPASPALSEDRHHLRADASQTNAESCEAK